MTKNSIHVSWLFVAALLQCFTATADAQTRNSLAKVQTLPGAKLQADAARALELWNRLHGSDVEILAIRYRGTVSNVPKVANEMLNSLAIVGQVTTGGTRLRLFSRSEATQISPPSGRKRFEQMIHDRIAVGDLLMVVDVIDKTRGVTFHSLNSRSVDGLRGSGGFFSTALVPAAKRTLPRLLPNTVCKDEHIMGYWFLGTSIDFEGCVAMDCKTKECRITESRGQNGQGTYDISPKAIAPGTRNGLCCEGGFAYAWATGEREIEVSVNAAGGGVTYKVGKGAGLGGPGSFSISECCENGRHVVGPFGGSLTGEPEPPAPKPMPKPSH